MAERTSTPTRMILYVVMWASLAMVCVGVVFMLASLAMTFVGLVFGR